MDHDAAPAVPALALPAPLAAGDALLSPAAQRTFDIDAFLCSRAYGQDAHSIRQELRAYSQALHARLLEVIHARYRDFVALATQLRGNATQIHSLTEHADVAHAEHALTALRTTLAEIVEQLVAEKQASADARRRKHILRTLLDVDAALQRVPATLDGTRAASIDVGALDAALDAVSLGTWADDAALVAPRVPWHVDRTTHNLRTRLGEALRTYIWADERLAGLDDADAAPLLATLRTRRDAAAQALATHATTLLASALADAAEADLVLALRTFRALRTYDRAALAQIDRACVAPTLTTCIARGAERAPLDPHAHTDDEAALARLTGIEAAPPADNGACPLACVLNGVLDAAAQLARVCAAAESVGGASLDVFNDVFWRRAATLLLDEHGGTLFFVGRPDAFHRNYTLYQQFAARLVTHAPSARARAAWATHDATRALAQRWQLSAFFHLCARETVTRLEAGVRSAAPSAGFAHGALAHLLAAFVAPWRATRHVPALAARQWRLSLHVLSRYATYLDAAAPRDGEVDTPAALAQAAALLADAEAFEARVQRCFDAYLLPKLVPAADDREAAEVVRAALRAALAASLGRAASLAPRVGEAVVGTLQRQCAEPLRHVRAGSAPFRARGAAADAPSAYVAEVLHPLHTLLADAQVQRVDAAVRAAWARAVLDATLARYGAAIDTMTHNLASLRRLKRSTPALHTSADAETDAGVYAQLRTDVAALRAQAAALASDTALDLATDAWAALEARVADARDS
ncbi:hypothetical protein MBRA1_001376 [Malassezia brasiliensis]|uniref:Conserved oligomeric Golgi complex subunit 2 n=1 Tax=Malassezia brasiliensis TaxID=1821822 RepID=A0AAF0IN97_9BASI|nr:hypothetical protein MBRA1_001376 [Malassezia brasiliensis]